MDHKKLITLFSNGKEVLIQHNLYTDATIFRDIQNILETDGENLSDESLIRFVSIFKNVRDRLKKDENGE